MPCAGAMIGRMQYADAPNGNMHYPGTLIGRMQYAPTFGMRIFSFGRVSYAGADLDTIPGHHEPLSPARVNNKDYADMLQADGWPVDLLNTAAEAAYLSHEEKNMILAMNLIRYDPTRYAALYVASLLPYFIDKQLHLPGLGYILVTREGDAPVKELYEELKRTQPVDILQPSEGLSRAAASHAAYQSRNGQTGHSGQGGTRARVEREGTWLSHLAENIAYGNPNAHYAILMLMIDDGVPDRGHRINMLKAELQVAGMAWATHPRYEGGVYVIKYAGGFTP